ncbi:hypothetical protein VE00_01712 [Pseudogymnoascus sp. WSF 3629]|nr:hypothetical protein VE00_01712 [Pseudogymnoascus sp. WSF 3629]
MMYSILSSAILGASVVLANAIPGGSFRRDATAIELVDMIYEGPITPSGKNYTLTGDAKASPHCCFKPGIYEQILQLNPSYNINDFNVPAPKIASRTPIATYCDVTPNHADSKAIQEGIDYLNSLGAGACRLGPRAGTRVSCSWKSAIYYWNDNNYDIAVSCNYLGYGLSQNAYDICSPANWPLSFSAQVFDSGNYNVIISKSNQFGEGDC